MGNLLNQDFQEFIESLNSFGVKYLLVGGYAVIAHGYIRSTGDMDVWVKKDEDNYDNIIKAFSQFGLPPIPEADFLGNSFDVWSFGRDPSRIDIMSEVKGVKFDEAFEHSKTFLQNNIPVRYIDIDHLIKAKEAAGRLKDKADIEQLRKKRE
jgi:hypothetical protein